MTTSNLGNRASRRISRVLAGVLRLVAAAGIVTAAAVAVGSMIVAAGHRVPGISIDPSAVNTKLVVAVGTGAVAVLTATAARLPFTCRRTLYRRPGVTGLARETPQEHNGSHRYAHPEYRNQGARCLDDGTIEVYVDDRYLILLSPVDARYVAERLNAAAGLSAMLTDTNDDRTGIFSRMPWSPRRKRPTPGV